MLIVRRSEERHHIANEKQTTWMTFDPESKIDPLQNGFRLLKILNEEILPPGTGFVLHTHKDMVIVTYVREGMVIYRGPLEKPDLLEAKDIHSALVDSGTKQYAFNPSSTEEAHVFQSGFTPCDNPAKPEGAKKLFTHADRKGILKLVASPDGREGSLCIQQDVQIFSTFINKGNHMIHELKPGRSAWIHLVKGELSMDEFHLKTGDGVGLSEERAVSFTAESPSEILLFDLGPQAQEGMKSEARNEPQASGVH